MTLFINGHNLTNPFWGVNRVSFELIWAMDRLLEEQPAYEKALGSVVLLSRDQHSPIDGLRCIRYEHLPGMNYMTWEQLSLPWRTRGQPLIGFQGRNPVLKRNCATYIHDLQTVEQAQSYSLRHRLEGDLFRNLTGRNHRTIFTVSDFSAKQIARLGVAQPERIVVVYNGLDHSVLRANTASPSSSLPKVKGPFVLAQSSTRVHKNIRMLIELFARTELAELSLVLFGECTNKDFEAIGVRSTSNVHFAGLVGDDELQALMTSALCFAFPSITEGFGLPPLEAMQRGTPAVVSNGGAIPEVCGDAAIALDPYQPDLWLSAFINLQRDMELRRDFAARGQRQAAEFTWSRAARTVIDTVISRHL